MGRLAGYLAWAGAIALAVWTFLREGGGRAGWEAARNALRERFPAAAPNSIQAIIDIAQDSVGVGRRQDRGGPGYTPPPDVIPDARRIERDAGIPDAGIPGERPQGVYYHEVIIEVYDPRWPDDPIQQYGITIDNPELLTNEQIEQIVEERARGFIDAIVGSDPTRFDPEELYTGIRHGGVWIGY